MNRNQISIGFDKNLVNRIGLGCMGMSEFYGRNHKSEKGLIKIIHKALDLGINFFDTADVYGNGKNEKLLGKALKDKRNKAFIASKFGMVRNGEGDFIGFNGKPKYVKLSCEKSLKNLNTDTIDLYYIHRKDPKVEIEVTIEALSNLVKEGKIKNIGLSEFTVEDLYKAYNVYPISALQTEYSLWSREPEQRILKICNELNITFVASSPLGRGFLTGAFKDRSDLSKDDWRLTNPRFSSEAFLKNKVFIDVIDKIAKNKKITKAQVALAWLLNKNKNIAVIPGTNNVSHLKENLMSEEIRLSKTDLKKIEDFVPLEGFGSRYNT